MKFNVRIGEVMTKDVKTVSPDESIKKAAQLMRNEKIGSVIVMGEKNIKGIVTSTDIVNKYVADGVGTSVSDIMTKDPAGISPNKTIEDAARLMTEKNIEKLLVFDMNKFVGIITNNDIIRIEPALYETILEKLKMGEFTGEESNEDFTQCESCGNYSDDAEEVDGTYICAECKESEEK